MPSNRVVATAVLVMLLSSCTMIPEYKRPDLPVTDSWPAGSSYIPTVHENSKDNSEASDVMVMDLAWQDYFRSDRLKAIIKMTLDNNRNLKVALLTIEKAKASYGIQHSSRLPTIAGEGSFSRSGVPEDLSSTGSSMTSSTINADLAVTSYELDFFGRVKSLDKEELESYLATEEAFLNTRIALIAEIADSYLEYLANKRLLLLAENTFKAQEETYSVVKKQYELGSATRLDLAQAATSVENSKVSISQYTRLTAQARNAIILLAGSDVDKFLDDSETIESIHFMENLPEGLPSKILLARPDIRQAEHQLKAANADIGAARAALYPAISLTGSFGLASDSLSSLLTSGAAWAWNFAPSVSIPIFNRDGLKASLEVARVSEKIAAAEYESAIQTAFREVADQLAARGTYKKQLAAQEALVAASQNAYELSSARYKNGIDNFLTVLDSQRSLLSAQQNAVTVRQAYLSNLVNLYKVLGGGQL